MPGFTTNLGIEKPTEAEPFDVDVVNANMDIIDGLCNCADYTGKTSTSTVSNYGATNSTQLNKTAIWRFKKFTNGTLRCSTKIACDGMVCETGSSAPYQSGFVKIRLPFNFTEIYHVNISANCGSHVGWAADVSDPSDMQNLMFRCLTITKETSSDAGTKYVCIEVEGAVN